MVTRRASLVTLSTGCLSLTGLASAASSSAVYEAFFRQSGDLTNEFFVLAWVLDASELGPPDDLLALEFPRTHRKHRSEDFGVARVRVVSDAEYIEIFSGRCADGWAEFRRRFPQAKALVRLSHVHYSANGAAASLLAKVGSGCFGSTVDYFMFVKSASGWRFGARETIERS